MAYITKAKAVENTPVRVAVYDAPLGTPYSDIAKYPIVNTQAREPTKSILSQLDNAPMLADVNGWKVTMVAKLGENEFVDTVEIIGEKNRSFHVRINGEVYSVVKSVVRFINKVEVVA